MPACSGNCTSSNGSAACNEASYVETLVVLNAFGRECLEDFDRLREDDGFREMLGYEVPSPEAARKFCISS